MSLKVSMKNSFAQSQMFGLHCAECLTVEGWFHIQLLKVGSLHMKQGITTCLTVYHVPTGSLDKRNSKWAQWTWKVFEVEFISCPAIKLFNLEIRSICN